jgi:UDP-N-acetylmuramoylalanine--D-glutamate ligase
LGETGVAAARWCARLGARLRVADTRAEPGGLAALRDALAQSEVEYRLGCDASFDVALLDGVTQVVLSPGLAPTQAPAADLLREAEARGIEVVGEIELFARALADLAETREYRPRLLTVTGTNGRAT